MTRHRPARPAAASLVAALAVVATTLPVTTWPATAFPATAGPATATPPTGGAGRAPSPGTAGLGDRLYPRLGNGGYDARHYRLDLRYATRSPSQGIDGTVTMVARATKALSRFNLDFAGDRVGSVTVDGRRARLTRRGEELVITPQRAIRDRARFVVTVRHFTARPTRPNPDVLLSAPFFYTRDGSATAGQPDAMHDVFPSNDHPRDKATFSFRLDVPRGTTAVANGVLTGRRPQGSRTIWTYRQRQPMATELTQLAVGDFTVIRRRPVFGVRVRDVVPTRVAARYRNVLRVERSQLHWMRQRVGRYPFDTYGSLVVRSELGFALETQTLSLFDSSWFTGSPRAFWEPVLLHELSHQWFGNSVSPAGWSDVWLNEGHATWYELTYAVDRRLFGEGADAVTVSGLMRRIYEVGDAFRSRYGPVARPRSGNPRAVFSDNAYYGGALVLYALRQKVGDRAFGRIEREWVRRYQGRSASTRDFIRLASQVSGKPLGGFLSAWLYGRTTPPMPGHPRWKVEPATSNRASASQRLLPLHRH